MWSRRDNQEVGLEAATLERVRNSSLVDASRRRESNGAQARHRRRGSGIKDTDWVGERRVASEAAE